MVKNYDKVSSIVGRCIHPYMSYLMVLIKFAWMPIYVCSESVLGKA